MKAYADFSEHPSELNRALQVAGIEAINIPVKRTTYDKGGKSVERVKNAADMVLALDAVLEAIEAYTARRNKVFLLVSGDRDYVKLVTILRNRYDQRVVIAGVPGQVSGDLVAAAGGEKDPIEIKQVPKAEKHEIKHAIVKMVKNGPAPLEFWSVRMIDQWAQDTRHNIPGTAKDRRDAIRELLSEQVINTKERTWKGRPVTEAALDEAKAKEFNYL